MLNREETSFSLNDIHLIGFSLGGQVVGKAGFALNGKLGRITGLDPAGNQHAIFRDFQLLQSRKIDHKEFPKSSLIP